MPRFFLYPFAVSGQRTEVPGPTDPDGNVSYQQGYGPDYSADPASDPDAKNIPRTSWNSLIYDITDNIRQYQINGTPEFITAADNGGTAFSYSKDARVRYDAGSGFAVYVSLVDSNTSLPSDATKWAVDIALTAGNKGDVTIASNGNITINNNAVTATKIASDAVTTIKILDDNVTAAKLATNSVTTIKIADDNVTTAKILNANVTLAKMANLAQYQLIGRSSSGTGVPQAVSSSANVFTMLGSADNAAIRSNIGLGTAAIVNTGTSGSTIGLLNGDNTYGGQSIFGHITGVTTNIITELTVTAGVTVDGVLLKDGRVFAGGGVNPNSSGGARFTKLLTNKSSLNFGSISSGASEDLTITVSGATVSNPVVLGLPSNPTGGIIYMGFVSASDTVTVRATNITSSPINPPAQTFGVYVFNAS